MKKLLAGMLLALSIGSVGCAYGAVAVAQDGTVYVARNDGFLFGALRKIYACKPSGETLTCVAVAAP
jgi:hypothetical protein